MADIINFPSLANREWSVWEDAIRKSSRGTVYDEYVLDIAIPHIKEHWSVLFQSTTIESTPKPFPRDLTEEQAAAIQSLLQSNVQLVIDYHKTQRSLALSRLIQCELSLAYHRIHGFPT